MLYHFILVISTTDVLTKPKVLLKDRKMELYFKKNIFFIVCFHFFSPILITGSFGTKRGFSLFVSGVILKF